LVRRNQRIDAGKIPRGLGAGADTDRIHIRVKARFACSGTVSKPDMGARGARILIIDSHIQAAPVWTAEGNEERTNTFIYNNSSKTRGWSRSGSVQAPNPRVPFRIPVDQRAHADSVESGIIAK